MEISEQKQFIAQGAVKYCEFMIKLLQLYHAYFQSQMGNLCEDQIETCGRIPFPPIASDYIQPDYRIWR